MTTEAVRRFFVCGTCGNRSDEIPADTREIEMKAMAERMGYEVRNEPGWNLRCGPCQTWRYEAIKRVNAF
jgi:hypothetical protein